MRPGPTRFLLLLLAAASAAACKASPKGPRIESVEPRVTIAGQATIALASSAFREQSSDPAQVQVRVTRLRALDGTPAADAPQAYTLAVQGAPGTVQRVFLPEAAAAIAGVYAVEVDAAAGRTLRLDDAFAAIPVPEITGPATDAVCVEALPFEVGVAGTGLPAVDGRAGSLRVTSQGPSGATVQTLLSAAGRDCAAVPFAGADLRLCSRAVATSSTLPIGSDATVQLEPLGTLAFASAPWPFLLGRAPTIGTSTLLPWYSVAAGSTVVRLELTSGRVSGSPGSVPTVTLGGTPLAVAVTNCVTGSTTGLLACFQVNVTVPQGFPSGAQPLTLTAGAPACSAQATVRIAPPTVVTAPQPAFVCGSSRVRLTGSGFLRPAVEGSACFATALTDCQDPFSCGWVDVDVTGLAGTTCDLTVVSQTEPAARSAPVTVQVYESPQLGVPSPWFVFNGGSRTIHATSPLSGAPLAATAKWLPTGPPPFPPSPPPVALPVSRAGDLLALDLPAGLPAGAYLLSVSDGTPCPALSFGLRVASDPVFTQFEFSTDGFVPLPRLWTPGGAIMAPPGGLMSSWDPFAGNPGGAQRVAAPGGVGPWYFELPMPPGIDVALLRFDLRTAGSGAALAAPDVAVVPVDPALPVLTRALAALAGDVWSHHELSFTDAADWTATDAAGARAATAAELRQVALAESSLLVRGAWIDGAHDTWLDNLAVELHR